MGDPEIVIVEYVQQWETSILIAIEEHCIKTLGIQLKWWK